MNKNTFYFYNEHPKTCDPYDFWGQVKRTVNGVSVSQEQIQLIVSAIVANLALTKNDYLLDLCCGNGALSSPVFKYCSGGVGVDFSEYLISVANECFVSSSGEIFLLQDVIDFCSQPISAEKFSKALCYGAFSYFDQDQAEKLLKLIRNNFPNLECVFIGNCPDKARLSNFVGDRDLVLGAEKDPGSPIGVWRTESEFSELVDRAGWQVTFHRMPEQYYAAYYRYDAILERK